MFSYNGGLFWGFTADWETVPDLHDFVVAVEESFAELQQRAAQAVKRQARKVDRGGRHEGGGAQRREVLVLGRRRGRRRRGLERDRIGDLCEPLRPPR